MMTNLTLNLAHDCDIYTETLDMEAKNKGYNVGWFKCSFFLVFFF